MAALIAQGKILDATLRSQHPVRRNSREPIEKLFRRMTSHLSPWEQARTNPDQIPRRLTLTRHTSVLYSFLYADGG
jgi:hypothetical protein